MTVRAWLAGMSAAVGMSCLAAQEVNTATRAELERLDGLGVTMTERLLVERERAPFRNWDDLERRVRGIKGARAQRLQAQGATVNGERGPRPHPRDEAEQ
jgi:competence protein ComEA